MNINGTGSSGLDASRITGLSGFDSESIVKQLLAVQKQRIIDPINQKIQLLKWKQEDYRSANTKLLNLHNSVRDLRLQGTFNAKTVSSSDETALSATAKSTAVNGSYSIEVISLASAVSKESTPIDAAYTHSGGSQSFTLTGKDGAATITVEDGHTIANVVNSINNETKNTGIKAVYDSGQNKFYLMSTETGSDAKIEVSDTDGFLAGVLGVNTATANGTDARIKLNGGSELSFSSNQFEFLGISMNLKKAGQTVNLTVSNDTDALYEKIKAFVDAYNSAVDDLGDRLSEKRYRDYMPLSDEQKEEMSEEQIKKWEEKARSGLLNGDALLIRTSSNIRNLAMSRVSGVANSDYNSLSAIGINSTSDYTNNGQLVIDEAKLKAALADDPDAVMELFTKTGSTTAETGVAMRLYNEINNDMNLIKDKAGSASYSVDNSTLGKELDELGDRLDIAEDRLDTYEDRLWKQYTALETALQRMNNQSSYLFSMFNSNSGS